MKRKIALCASALILVFSAGAVQAHGSLFGIFFKHHWHDVCGNHHVDHDAVKACKKKHAPKHHAHHSHGHHGHGHHNHGHHGHGHHGSHHAYPAKNLNW